MLASPEVTPVTPAVAHVLGSARFGPLCLERPVVSRLLARAMCVSGKGGWMLSACDRVVVDRQDPARHLGG